MPVTHSRRPSKRPRPISTGSKIIRFRILNHSRRFTVHEDLICQTSSFFKTRLQKNRKHLITTASEDCCVCHDSLNPTTKDITYCVTCGQNIHEVCIEQWKRSAIRNKLDVGPATCPMCRAPWKNEPLLKSLSIEEALDVQAVQGYLDWLYSGTLHIAASISRKSDLFNVALLKCWAVASAVDDECFKNDVVEMFFRDAEARFWSDSIHWAFVEGRANEEIKGFVVEVFMAYMKPGWFGEQGGMWPEKFVRVLADKALEGMVGRKRFADVRREWLGSLRDADVEVEVEDCGGRRFEAIEQWQD